MTSTLGLTPLLATSAFAVGYCLGFLAMKAIANGSLRLPRLHPRSVWRWLLGRPVRTDAE